MANRAETNRRYYLANRERLVKEQRERRAAKQAANPDEFRAANRVRQRRRRAKRRQERAEFAEQWRRENNFT